jgi:SAM-dependent methyltransferase
VSLQRHRADWERLAADDPLWAVLTRPGRRGGGWEVDEFLATGAAEIDGVLEVARELGLPAGRARALDFGCGAGRLTRALARHFEKAVGIDIAEGMTRAASRLNADVPNATFVVNDRPDLSSFADASFDLVYSSLVLQHLPGRRAVERYVRDFLRVARSDGLVVFGVPDAIGFPYRLQLSRRAYALLRTCGVSEDWLLRRTPLTPMRMTVVAERYVRMLCDSAGAAILHVEPSTDGPVRTHRYYVSPSSARYTDSWLRAAASQVKPDARARPRSRSTSVWASASSTP